jgi:signal transduction histidine kinase
MPMRRWFATVRVRTTVFATLVVTAALIIGGILLLELQQRELVAGLESSARNRATDVAGLAKRGALPTTLTAAKEDAAFTQVVTANGRVVAASKNLRDDGPVLDDAPLRHRVVVVNRTIPELDHDRFRVAIRRVATTNGPVLVYAGDRLETADAAIKQLALVLGFGVPLLAGLVALVTWRVTRRALQPVEAIRSEVSEIGEGELHRRVPEPPTHDEVGRLARTMNRMLARLDDASDRQRRFVSDASHELQSPLTSLRARLEVNLAARRDPDWRASEEEALAEVTEMQRLVEDLLMLARLDASNVAPPRRVPVDLDDVILREAERLRTRGRVAVDVHRVSAGQVPGDLDQLRRAVRNVLDNAERHAARDISISLQENNDAIEIRIADDGPGIAVEDRDLIFERFGRIDDARTRDGASTGLGLAIAREIVVAHDGTISIEDASPGACFVMRFPAPNGS